MASLRATTLLVLMQIIVAFYTVILSSSFCGARTIPGGALDPNHPACLGGACPRPSIPYTRPCIYGQSCYPPGRLECERGGARAAKPITKWSVYACT
uniref:Uncharacterized protein n=1 Tax=Oryza punctata TaxID=4537 RepID=A0A0E0LBU5_ORYPU